MSKYTEFDAKLIHLVKNGATTSGPLTNLLVTDAQPFVTRNSGAGRVVDRRLQALRKAGRLIYSCGRWYVLETENA